jgi:hypothetical protein
METFVCIKRVSKFVTFIKRAWFPTNTTHVPALFEPNQIFHHAPSR